MPSRLASPSFPSNDADLHGYTVRAPRRHISLAGAVVVLSVIAAIAVVIWVLVLVRSEESPIIEPTMTPGSPVSSPSATPDSTSEATPLPTFSPIPTVAPGSLPDLLNYAPDRIANDSLPLSDVARYADIEGWMTARGIPVPTGPEDPDFPAWEQELDALALPAILATRGSEPVWLETYGFQLADVDQVLAVGQAPDFVLVLKGDFDADAMQDAWVSNGYQAVRSQDVTMWSLFPGDSIDLSAPASRPALGNFNNVVLLEDGTLIATSRLARLEEAVAVVQGDEPAISANPTLSPLLVPGADAESLATAIITRGSVLATVSSTPEALSSPPGITAAAVTGSPVASPEAPLLEVGLLLMGIGMPGGADLSPTLMFVLSFDSVEEATYGSFRVDDSLRNGTSPVTGDSYGDRVSPLGHRVVATDDGGAVLVLRTSLPRGTDDWISILEERDLGFVMWEWEPDDD